MLGYNQGLEAGDLAKSDDSSFVVGGNPAGSKAAKSDAQKKTVFLSDSAKPSSAQGQVSTVWESKNWRKFVPKTKRIEG